METYLFFLSITVALVVDCIVVKVSLVSVKVSVNVDNEHSPS